MRAVRLPETAHGSNVRSPGGELALDFFSNHLGQDLLVQCEIGYQPLKTRVLFLQLT